MKRKLNPEQLVKDGFVQLKSLRQLQKQGILPKITLLHEDDEDCVIDFNNTFSNPGFVVKSPEGNMLHALGKIRSIESIRRIDDKILAFYDGYWLWPIECIKC